MVAGRLDNLPDALAWLGPPDFDGNTKRIYRKGARAQRFCDSAELNGTSIIDQGFLTLINADLTDFFKQIRKISVNQR